MRSDPGAKLCAAAADLKDGRVDRRDVPVLNRLYARRDLGKLVCGGFGAKLA